jgi:hypothetical protein
LQELYKQREAIERRSSVFEQALAQTAGSLAVANADLNFQYQQADNVAYEAHRCRERAESCARSMDACRKQAEKAEHTLGKVLATVIAGGSAWAAISAAEEYIQENGTYRLQMPHEALDVINRRFWYEPDDEDDEDDEDDNDEEEPQAPDGGEQGTQEAGFASEGEHIAELQRQLGALMQAIVDNEDGESGDDVAPVSDDQS